MEPQLFQRVWGHQYLEAHSTSSAEWERPLAGKRLLVQRPLGSQLACLPTSRRELCLCLSPALCSLFRGWAKHPDVLHPHCSIALKRWEKELRVSLFGLPWNWWIVATMPALFQDHVLRSCARKGTWAFVWHFRCQHLVPGTGAGGRDLEVAPVSHWALLVSSA